MFVDYIFGICKILKENNRKKEKNGKIGIKRKNYTAKEIMLNSDESSIKNKIF